MIHSVKLHISLCQRTFCEHWSPQEGPPQVQDVSPDGSHSLSARNLREGTCQAHAQRLSGPPRQVEGFPWPAPPASDFGQCPRKRRSGNPRSIRHSGLALRRPADIGILTCTTQTDDYSSAARVIARIELFPARSEGVSRYRRVGRAVSEAVSEVGDLPSAATPCCQISIR